MFQDFFFLAVLKFSLNIFLNKVKKNLNSLNMHFVVSGFFSAFIAHKTESGTGFSSSLERRTTLFKLNAENVNPFFCFLLYVHGRRDTILSLL